MYKEKGVSMKNNMTDISKLNKVQKTNYVKNTLFTMEINEAVDILLKDEKKDLIITKIIVDTLKEDLIINRIKEQCNLNDNNNAKLFVYSKILGIFNFYNKTVILNNFLRLLSDEELKDVAFYEYQNRTTVSLNNKAFDKFCHKYKKQAMDDLMIDDEEIEKFDKEKESYNMFATNPEKRSNNKIIIPLVVLAILLIGIFIYKIHDYNNMISKYKGEVYPGIYINNIDLSGVKLSELDGIVDGEKENMLNGYFLVSNVNGENKYYYNDLGIEVKTDSVSKKIKDYNNNLSFFKKIKYIQSGKRNKTFYLKASMSDEKVTSFVELLKSELNTDPRDDGLIIDNDHNVKYDKGASGFTLDESKTRENILSKLANLNIETKLDVTGKIIKNEIKYQTLSTVNTKVSSYTTYFANAGNRGHNINLASSRLNNTIIMPGDTFSYLKVVGPYGSSNGYLPAPVYLNSEVKTENGGGVCQLASTLYNSTLRAGLETISRRGHTFAPTYVPRGLDATVYGTSTDFKVKNNYEFPVYIVSYIKGNYLTVDIWTNENALSGLTYEPYSVASNGGYLAYLNVLRDGKVIETKYLDRSVYKVHP